MGTTLRIGTSYLDLPHELRNRIHELLEIDQRKNNKQNIDKYKRSFQNGIYDAKVDVFFLYTDDHKWDIKARLIQEYRRKNGWGNDYTVIPPHPKQVSMKYFDQIFRFEIDSINEDFFDPTSIIVPELDTFFVQQGLEKDTILWLYSMLGRLCFEVKEKDEWRIALYMKENVVMKKLLEYMFSSDCIGTISTDIPKECRLSKCHQKAVCISYDDNLDMTDMTSSVVGEEMFLKASTHHHFICVWKTPMFWFSTHNNDRIDILQNIPLRSLFPIEFAYDLSDSKSQVITYKLFKNMDFFFRKSVRLYLDMARQFGDQDIWERSYYLDPPTPCYPYGHVSYYSILPNQLHDFKTRIKDAGDALYHFMRGYFEFDCHFEMPVSDFVPLYQQFRKSIGLQRCGWHRTHYLETFQELGIYLDRRDGEVDVIFGLRRNERALVLNH